MMRYRGYVGTFESNPRGKGYTGTITNITDPVKFEASDPDTLEQAFRDAVDNYIAACKDSHKKPEKPYSGFIMLRINPAIHRAAAEAARASGASLATFVTQILEKAIANAQSGKRTTSR
jgi:predicted HicB family RNase H-like nuclease